MKKVDIWSGVTIAGQKNEQTRKDRATQPSWTMEGRDEQFLRADSLKNWQNVTFK